MCEQKSVKRILSLFESASWEQEAIQRINVFVFHIHKPKFKSHLSLKGNKLGDFSVIPSEMYSLHRNTAQHSSSSVQEKPHTETLELLQFRLGGRVFVGSLYNNILYKFINNLSILTSWKGNMETCLGAACINLHSILYWHLSQFPMPKVHNVCFQRNTLTLIEKSPESLICY